MNRLELIIRAVRRDRPLQIGIGALVFLSVLLFQTLSQNSRKASIYASGPDGRAPLVVMPPFDESTKEEMFLAMIAGRAVVMASPSGRAVRLRPQLSPDEAQELSETLNAVFKLSCTDEYRPEMEKLFAGKSEEERKKMEKRRQTFCRMTNTLQNDQPD
nr:hypothetical protein [uncultured Hyphomonas sp.]